MFPDSIEVTFFGNCDLTEDFYQYLLLPGLNLHILFVFTEKNLISSKRYRHPELKLSTSKVIREERIELQI
jgi:hypothetical protein